MPLKIDPEFKAALLNLPEKEKDKYFLRLLKKDHILFHRLHHELIETETQDELRAELEEKIKSTIQEFNSQSANYFRSVLRYLSGDITYHTKVTTDKFGEPYLNTVMLVEATKKINPILQNHNRANEKLVKYIIGRTFKILTQVQKLHEDDQYEFSDLFKELAHQLMDNKIIGRYCVHCMLDFNWLLKNEIPEDITSIQRQARAAGMI